MEERRIFLGRRGRTRQYSGLTLDTALRDHFWWPLGTIWGLNPCWSQAKQMLYLPHYHSGPEKRVRRETILKNWVRLER